MIRERFAGDLKEAIKARDAPRVSTLRLICAAVKDRDIAARSDDNFEGVGDTEILAILAQDDPAARGERADLRGGRAARPRRRRSGTRS